MSSFVKLILVLAILAMAWGIFGPKIPGGSRSRKAVVLDDIAGFKVPLERFKLDCGRYPTTGEGLVSLMVRPLAMRGATVWRGPYTDVIPKDP